LSTLKKDSINQIKEEKKASQQVYRPFTVTQYTTKPLTRLERNMMLFTEIFIEPERERIKNLKEKEKEFTDLVHNVVNQQYDKILEYEFKKKDLDKKRA
jgi:hypothetical protein